MLNESSHTHYRFVASHVRMRHLFPCAAVHVYMYEYVHMHIFICLNKYIYICTYICVEKHVFCPTQSIVYVPLRVIKFQKSILLIVQYKYLKCCSGDFILQNLILRIRSCGTAFITQSSWLCYFHPTEICQAKIFCTPVVPAPKRHIGGGSP